MYYPYFRGKQYELLTIRETAPLLARSGFTPIIEPVKETLSGLERALQSVSDAKGSSIVIINPRYGDHAYDGEKISNFLVDQFEAGNVKAGILLTEKTDVNDALDIYCRHLKLNPCFIHNGFEGASILASNLNDQNALQIFIENISSRRRTRHFKESPKTLIRDGLTKRKNADYPFKEEFSDLHLTFIEEGLSGFGDFLIAGDDYSEGGGPAYAVAIHITFINPQDDDAMYIYHFVSDTKDTPTDPAGKFSEALSKLIKQLESGESHIFETSAIKEFRDLHSRGHFPGLGYLKKLSMKHHIETMAKYFQDNPTS